MAVRIPSLTTLRAFEAVARHLSFRNAAEELCVTHAAVSHQIKALEAEIGVELFIRTTRSVELTAAGRVYYPVVRDCLDGLAKGTAQVKSTAHEEVLLVQSYSSFTNTWLLPRLVGFQRDNPAVRVRVKTSFEDVDFAHQIFDIGIFKAPPFDDRLEFERLFTAEIFPVCAPGLATADKPLNEPADLVEHTLLRIPSSAGEADDWHLWLSAAGVPVDSVHFGPVFDNYPLALEAVVNGHGLAIARGPFAARDITAGHLVRPFELSVREPGAWYVATKKAGSLDLNVKLFREWLVREIIADSNCV